MAELNGSIQIWQRTHSQWATDDPTLLAGQIADSSDLGKMKIGPGVWSSLPYRHYTIAEIATLLSNKVDVDGVKVLSDNNYSDTDRTKVSRITISSNIDLDDMNTRVNDLDAAVVLKGAWSAADGTFPGAGAAQAGWSYLVNADGTVDGVEFKNGDRLIAVVDNASTSTYASNWYKADYTDRVNTVAGRTDNVVITSSDLSDFNSAVNALIAAETGASVRTKLGMTTAGNALAQLASPASPSYVRVNTDGTVTPLTAVELREAIGIRYFRISAVSDPVINSSTLTDIAGLVASLEANSEYQIQLILSVTGSTGGGKLGLTFPSGTTVTIGTTNTSTSVTAQTMTWIDVTSGVEINFTIASGGAISGYGEFTIRVTTGSTGGDIQVQYKAGTNGQNNTIIRRGTFMEAKKTA